MTSPETHSVDSRGLRVNVLQWAGVPDQPTILLHHGYLDHARSWINVATALAEKFNVLAVDARGHGDSGWVGQGGYYHFQDYVFDLKCVVDYFNLESLHLVGHSMGGMVCGYFAGTYPDKILSYTSIEGLGPPDSSHDDAPARMSVWIDGVQKKMKTERKQFDSLEELADRLCAFNPRLDRSFALYLAEHGASQTRRGSFVWKFDPLHQTRSPQQFYLDHARSFWRNISCPVLYVDGEHSNFRGMLDSRVSELASSSHETIPDAGHMIHHEQPQELSRILIQFLSGV